MLDPKLSDIVLRKILMLYFALMFSSMVGPYLLSFLQTLGFNVFGHYEIDIRCHITVPKVPYTALILMEKVTNYVDDMYVLFS